MFAVVFLMTALFVHTAFLARAETCESVPDGLPESELKAHLAACEAEIKEQTIKIQATQREATTLERDIDILAYTINRARNEIQKRALTIKKLGNDINAHEGELVKLSAQVKRMKTATGELLRRTNEMDERSLAEIVLSESQLSDAFADGQSFAYIEEALHASFDELRKTREAVELAKAKLKDSHSEESKQKGLKEIEERRTKEQEREKNRLLSLTKKEEEAYQAELRKKQAIALEIKNKILKLTAGGELRFEEALNIARVAEAGTGVRSALVLSILTQESGLGGVIGANLGRCFYNTPWNNNAGTVMSNRQKPSFLAIMRELGMNPDTTPVSCPIVSDGQYGGAMGPSQFMPTTWWDLDTETGYKRRVGKVTGANPPSPFNNVHAFTATALYLSDSISGCSISFGDTYNREACAGAKYYAGGNWSKYMKSYGASVANRAAEFQKDIDFLESQI